MTDWPDEWFREGSSAGGAGQAGAAAGQPTIGGAAPGFAQPAAGTVGAPGAAGRPGGAGATKGAEPTLNMAGGGDATGPTVRASANDLTQPGTARAASPAFRGGAPGGSARPGGSGSAWPDQPALRTPPGGRRPAPGAGGSGGSGWPPAPTRPGWRRWLRPRPIGLALVVIVCLALVGTVATYFWLDSHLVKKNVLVDYSGRPVQGQGSNWLITGSDSRQGLTDKQIRKLHTGFDIGGQRSDTIMVLHVPSGGGHPLLMSIPRDSYVDIPGFGHNKINAAYAFGGPKLLIETVENLTGLRIDHYMGIGFGGFVHVVDAIGGVRLCLKRPLTDPSAGLHLRAGCQVLTGDEALGFVRSRHDYATQDLQRIQNQRLFLSALLRKLTSTGVILNPFKGLPAASGVTGSMTVDNGTGLYQLVQAAFALKHPITTTVPISDSSYQTSAGDALLLNMTELKELATALNDGKPIPKGIIQGSKLGG